MRTPARCSPILRSRFLSSLLPMLCCGALLLACGSPGLRPGAPPAFIATADDLYVRGRNLHLERRYDEAIAAYQAALATDPVHVNAQNGLAIAYAERRQFDQAIPIWQHLTQGATITSGTGAAFLFANLGYARFLQGDYSDAVAALEKACLLDPLNGRAWQYLGETLQQLGQDERARQMLSQAAALRGHDLRADFVAVNGGARLPAIEQAVQAARHPERDWAFVDITRSASGVLELRRGPLPDARPATPAPAPVDRDPAPVASLEIRNGNGRSGMARQVARQLHDPGLKVVRLSNEKGYGVRQSRVEYRSAFRAQAERLAERMGAIRPVEAGVASHADLRLVIGSDLSPQQVAKYLAPPEIQRSAARSLAVLVSVPQQ
jgi:tetratricopeptide (TPR) repeat protein